MSTQNTFNLYHTLNKQIPKKDLTLKNKKDLLTFIEKVQSSSLIFKNDSSINHEEIAQNMLMLILEHAKYEGEWMYDMNTPDILPYNCKISKSDVQKDSKEYVEFDLDGLPQKLKWILFKFKNLILKENDE